MRYIQVPTISFTDSQGNVRPIKDLREIPVYQSRMVVNRIAREDFDFIAQKDDVFGRGHEGDAFYIWEANIVQVAERGFDLSNVRRITIPQIT